MKCMCDCGREITDQSPSDMFASQTCHEKFYGIESPRIFHWIAATSAQVVEDGYVNHYREGQLIGHYRLQGAA